MANDPILKRDTAKSKIVADRLEAISAKRKLTPKAVVDDARPANSPLHRYFTWNNGEAAEKYRLWEARELIMSVNVTFIGPKGDRRKTRAFVSVSDGGEEGARQHYMPTENAMQRFDMRQQLLERALRDAETWRLRYQTLTELAEIFEAIDHASEQAKKRNNRNGKGGK